MNLSVKRNLQILGCFLLGFQAFSQSCPVPPAGVLQGQFTITPNGSPAVTIVGHANGNTPLQICPSVVPATVTNTTVMGTGVRGYYHYPFNPSNSANPTIPTTGGALYPANNRFQFTVNTPGKYTIVQTTRSSTGAVLTYACKVIEIPAINTPVAEITSCTTRQITVEISDTDINKTFDSFEINWGDLANPATNIETFTNNKTNPNIKKTHTYPNNGTFTVRVTGKIAGQTCESPLTRTNFSANGNNTLTALPRITNITVMAETEAQMTYLSNNGSFEFYQKKLPATNWTIAQQGNFGAAFQTRPFAITNGSTEQYCYKIRQKNTCGTFSAFSDSVCTIVNNGSIGEHKAAVVKWKTVPYPGFNLQQVTPAAGTTNPGLASPAITNPTTSEYRDAGGNKTCVTYSYQVRAFKTTNGLTSISLPINIEVKDTTTPPTITNMLLSVNANRVELRPTFVFQAKEVNFFRANNTVLNILAPSTSQPLPDPLSEPDKQQQCYKVSYKGNCLVESKKSDEFCAMFLKPKADGIEWTAYKKFITDIDRYEIEKRGSAGFTLLKRVSATTLDYKPDPAEIDPVNGEIRYRIKAIAKTTNQVSYSNETVFAPKATLFVPEAFTPNNDGKNDRFDISGYFIKDFSLKVYNRWGITVFETDKFGVGKGWDGKLNNSSEMAPIGTYVYEYSVTDYKEQTEKKKGYFFLMQ
jgi:gliding motility-associated-like protein